MATSPLFKLKDIVYLVESAALGELEAYRIGAIKQTVDGQWVYQIFIEQKAPREQTVGDRIDLKTTQELFFSESEFTDLCSAIDAAIVNVESRITTAQNLLAACPVTNLPEVVPGNSKFDIDSTVYIKASASIGFLEYHKVISIHQVFGSQEFTYELDLASIGPGNQQRQIIPIFFKERELLTKCEALSTVTDALERKIGRLLGLKMAYCTEGSEA